MMLMYQEFINYNKNVKKFYPATHIRSISEKFNFVLLNLCIQAGQMLAVDDDQT